MFAPPSLSQRLAVRERPRGWPVMKQRWAQLLFLHWPIDPALLAAHLPPGLRVDTYDAKGWIGLVPFSMQRVRPIACPPIPGISWFLELNVRTYVYDSQGRPGVWFLSLDCNHPLAVAIGRHAFHLPYEHADMRATLKEHQMDYHCQRLQPGAATAHYHYPLPQAPQTAEEGSLEWFLVERYLLFSQNKKGELHYGQVHHSPYEIEKIHLNQADTSPLDWNGFSGFESSPPHSALVANPVSVDIFPLRRVEAAERVKNPTFQNNLGYAL